MQIGRDLADFVDRLRNSRGNIGQLLRSSRRILWLQQPEQRSVLDHQQILPQPIVQFGSDAFPLGFLRLDQLLREGLLRGLTLFQLIDAVLESR